MTHTFSLLYYLRKEKMDKEGKVPICLRITVEGKRSSLPTHQKIKPDRWNSKAQKVNGTNQETRSINAFLYNLKYRVQNCYRELGEKGALITADIIRGIVLGNTANNRHTLIEAFEKHNKRMGERVEIDVAKETHKRYITTLKLVKEFIKYTLISGLLSNTIEVSPTTNITYYVNTIQTGSSNVAGCCGESSVAVSVIQPTIYCSNYVEDYECSYCAELSAPDLSGVIYQWYYSSSMSGPFSAVSGANSSIIEAYEIGVGFYYCQFQQSGTCMVNSNILFAGITCLYAESDKKRMNQDSVIRNTMSISIYPNPNEGNFVLQINKLNSSNQSFSIKIFNMLGQEIYNNNQTINYANYTNEISLLNSSSGIYTMEIQMGNQVFHKQFSITH